MCLASTSTKQLKQFKHNRKVDRVSSLRIGHSRPIALIVAFVAAIALLMGAVLVSSTPAYAGGSDDPTPYTVDSSGITLPGGDTFQDGGHINLHTTQGDKNLHFESLNWPDDNPKKFYIGKSFIPWSAFGLTGCFEVSWVQIHGYNEHYGEGGQPSVYSGECGSGGGDQCVVDVINHDEESHQEYKYSKLIPAQDEVKHKEYRWKRNYSGPKEINGATWNGSSWDRTPGTWGAVPAHLNPPGANSIAATGTVPGGTYGLPNDSNLNAPGNQAWEYRYQTPDGGTQWFPSSTGWATQAEFDNAALTDIGYSGNGWQVADSKWVIDQEASPAKTVYYLTGGGQSDTNTNVNWTEETPSAPWTKIDERKVIDKAAWTETVYGPCPPELEECTATTSQHFTSLDGWDLSQTRATGHNELVENGLRVWTEGNTSTDKAAGYLPVDFALSDLGTGFRLESTATSGTILPALQIVLETGAILVYEPGAYGTNNVWSNQVVPGLSAGMGYTSFGSVNDILEVDADIRVVAIGYSLGSGVMGDHTITKIVANCVVYTFDKPVVSLPPNPGAEITSQCLVDGGSSATVQLSNPFTPAPYTTGTSATFTVKVDGVVKDTVTVDPNEVVNPLVYTFGEDSGDHLVEVFTGDTLIASRTVQSDCLAEEVTPVAPTFKQPTCDSPSKLTVPPQPKGVVYVIDGNKVTFSPENDDYTFPKDTQSVYEFKEIKPTGCDGLALTGSDLLLPGVLTALALLILGGGAVAWTRRTRSL